MASCRRRRLSMPIRKKNDVQTKNKEEKSGSSRMSLCLCEPMRCAQRALLMSPLLIWVFLASFLSFLFVVPRLDAFLGFFASRASLHPICIATAGLTGYTYPCCTNEMRQNQTLPSKKIQTSKIIGTARASAFRSFQGTGWSDACRSGKWPNRGLFFSCATTPIIAQRAAYKKSSVRRQKQHHHQHHQPTHQTASGDSDTCW